MIFMKLHASVTSRSLIFFSHLAISNKCSHYHEKECALMARPRDTGMALWNWWWLTYMALVASSSTEKQKQSTQIQWHWPLTLSTSGSHVSIRTTASIFGMLRTSMKSAKCGQSSSIVLSSGMWRWDPFSLLPFVQLCLHWGSARVSPIELREPIWPLCKKTEIELGLVHTCNPSTWDVEAGRLGV